MYEMGTLFLNYSNYISLGDDVLYESVDYIGGELAIYSIKDN